jgi:hypothetical protein
VQKSPEEIIRRAERACEASARDQSYVVAAKNGGQPVTYYADRETFSARLARDIEAKERLSAKMGLRRKGNQQQSATAMARTGCPH